MLLSLGNHRLLSQRQDVGHIASSKHAIVPAACNNPGAFQKAIAKAPPGQLVKLRKRRFRSTSASTGWASVSLCHYGGILTPSWGLLVSLIYQLPMLVSSAWSCPFSEKTLRLCYTRSQEATALEWCGDGVFFKLI